ncbi:MAG TPA: hypothetical protein VHB73_05100 [Alphaproteobacteria bacterium]|nr:hypothetical protein [Alphaproteobacteria bacterium]
MDALSPESFGAVLPRRLMLVNSMPSCTQQLSGRLRAWGFDICTAASVKEAQERSQKEKPDAAITELRVAPEPTRKSNQALHRQTGLGFVEHWHAMFPEKPILMVTEFAHCFAAVRAAQLGAVSFLEWGRVIGDPGLIAKAFLPQPSAREEQDEGQNDRPWTPDQIKYDHMMRVFTLCGEDVTKAAQKLGVHRRSLQRQLIKTAPYVA